LFEGKADCDVVAEPRERNAHQNCLSVRRSFSQNGLISEIP